MSKGSNRSLKKRERDGGFLLKKDLILILYLLPDFFALIIYAQKFNFLGNSHNGLSGLQ